MATTFSALVADTNIMKAGNESVLLSAGVLMTAAQLQTLYYFQAKAIMNRDIRRACHIDQENTTDIDDITDLNSQELSEALAYLQLHLFFLDYDQGDGSAGRYRADLNWKRYTEYKNKYNSIMMRNKGASYSRQENLTIG